jgi:hypothetical protein
MPPQIRPIIFSSPMIRAILDGRKIMTRRVIKPQPTAVYYVHPEHPVQVMEWKGTRWYPASTAWGTPQPGDRLWVKETWCVSGEGFNIFWVRYGADQSERRFELIPHPPMLLAGKWRPSIFMPRWASRITLEITAVRIERVQDITEEDAKAEGCGEYVGGEGPVPESSLSVEPGYWHPNFFRDGFRFLWNSLNAKRGYGWESNCWVWVISFRRLP